MVRLGAISHGEISSRLFRNPNDWYRQTREVTDAHGAAFSHVYLSAVQRQGARRKRPKPLSKSLPTRMQRRWRVELVEVLDACLLNPAAGHDPQA